MVVGRPGSVCTTLANLLRKCDQNDLPLNPLAVTGFDRRAAGEHWNVAQRSIDNVVHDECTCLPCLLPVKQCRLELSCQLFTEISDCIREFRDVTQLVLNQNKITRITCLDPLQQLACLCERCWGWGRRNRVWVAWVRPALQLGLVLNQNKTPVLPASNLC